MAAANPALQMTVKVLTATVSDLRAEMAALRAQLVTTSKNSSMPSSSGGLGKPAPRSLRCAGGRSGGQWGHPGQTPSHVTTPGVTVRDEPVCCAGCGAPFAQAAQVGVERRQVFDRPATGHARESGACGLSSPVCAVTVAP